MTVEELKFAIHKFDLVSRPCVIFIHPDDAELLKKSFPDIEKSIVIQATSYVERGKCYLAKRKDLELDMWESEDKE